MNRLRPLAAGVALAIGLQATAVAGIYAPLNFQRIAHFPVFLNTDVNEDTVAEIVAASEDGRTLIYTDGEAGGLGFVDITDPYRPAAAGFLALDGEPTSVAVAGRYALTAINQSQSFADPAGALVVVEVATRTEIARFDLGGQPDSVAVSPDRRFAAIAIENERDEDLGNGAPPQPPAGFLTIVELDGAPAQWQLRQIALTGFAERFPEDPEPEYVDINIANIAAVTLQENNHIVLVHLPSGKVIRHWPAGAADLTEIDIEENQRIELTGALPELLREPDGITWLSPATLATADEGDLNGGSRGFTRYNAWGEVIDASGNQLEHQAVRLGHYPEERSENKGNEPENVEYARFGKDRLLFVGSERASFVAVYELGHFGRRRLRQALPAGVAPEGLLAIPARDLFVSASEEDDRDAGVRSLITLYKRLPGAPSYPTVESADRPDGTPIPWGALSGLAVDPNNTDRGFSVPDSFYAQSRIYTLNLGAAPARIDGEIVLRDTVGSVAAVAAETVNADGTVNLDLEGIAVRAAGGFWLVSEGAGSVDDGERPVTVPNLLLQVAADGAIVAAHTLPASTQARQRRFGLEGVAEDESGKVYVAFQREWVDDPDDHVRIGRLDPGSGEWAFYYYPIERPTSANGGWVGLSDLTYLGNGRFAVIERDNQAGADAAIKHLATFSVSGLTPLADPGSGTPAFPVLSKQVVRDLIADLAATGGAVLEKIEGLAATADGSALVVNDNDGVDGSNGETQLLRLPDVF